MMADNLVPSLHSSDDTDSGEVTPSTGSEMEYGGAIQIPLSTVLRELHGVAAATKADNEDVEYIGHIIKTAAGDQPSPEQPTTLSLHTWLDLVKGAKLDESRHHRACLATAVAYLCGSGRADSTNTRAADLDVVWSIVYDALQDPTIPYAVSRSSQGFLSVPLSSSIKNGNIEELIRLHVWEANDIRGTYDLGIHAHQPFIQSWILAGEGTNHTYEGSPADSSVATHAEYGVSWSDSGTKESGKAYKIQPTASTIVNTGKLVRIVKKGSESHARNTTYTVPTEVFHRSEVVAGTLHATIAFFDSHRGFQQDAPVLGPADGVSYTSKRDPAGKTALELVEMVQSVREWEVVFEQGKLHTMNAEWEESLRAYNKALHICDSDPDFPKVSHYRNSVMERLGHMYRMLGRNELASKVLEDARQETPQNKLRVAITGELGVVYRHMSRLDDAKEVLEDQYKTAQDLGLDREVCRAIGNLGMVNYQLSLVRDPALIYIAMDQLNERVESSRRLREVATHQLSDPASKFDLMEFSLREEAIGLGRLSLCFQQKGDVEQVVSTAFEALKLQSTQRDSTKVAFARGFYGLALLYADRVEEAVAQFNLPDGCTPIISMCKEPSEEHREYIRKMIDAGADLELRDEQGYSALDCAVYSGDTETQKVIEEGLKRKFIQEAEHKLEQQRYEAVLRKGYRDIFQDKLRPVLLRSSDNFKELRCSYAEALEKDKEKAVMFDHLKFVRYTDFLGHGRLPGSSDGITREVNLDQRYDDNDEFIIFMSYRWVGTDQDATPPLNLPDDPNNSQYRRMLRAIDQFLKLHPNIAPESVGIWIDFACVDQTSWEHQQPGVVALPMNLAQCNAMISLIDGHYYERSWCCVEVLMIQTLRSAYKAHVWYEHVIDPISGKEYLREGPSASERSINMSETKVTHESDRPRLMFLERQTRLIG
ncbi:hypothetical protein M426DRAFT_256954 [Hypoxylon sp. CI-4A]|nr:hypothetical protein M426DRAFT_256954 [Hypoxylon sp. CI-4A]